MGQEFQKYALPEDVQLRGVDDFFEQVRKATAEALRRGIQANAIVINKNMVYVPEFCGMDLKMVCGLHCYVTKDELPEGYSFAVLHDPTREKKDVVVHGRWIPCENGGYYYSVCDSRVAFLVHNKYCPNCGAKMDGGSDND